MMKGVNYQQNSKLSDGASRANYCSVYSVRECGGGWFTMILKISRLAYVCMPAWTGSWSKVAIRSTFSLTLYIDLTGSVMRLEEHPYKSTISEVLNTPHPTCL